MRQATSKRLRGVTELTVVADLESGLVPVRETRSYATRLRILLRTLFAIRQKGVEEAVDVGFVGPLERLQILHFVRWCILDSDRKLMLAVSFDGPWEPYIRKIADSAGPLLDLILCNCKDYEENASDQGYQKFAAWVRKHQVESEFFFAGEPGISADDIRYLRKLAEAQRVMDKDAFEEYAAKLRILGPDDEAKASLRPDPELVARLRAGRLRVLQALHGLRELYPGDPTKPAEGSRGHLFLLRTARLILPGLWNEDLPDAEMHGAALRWLSSEEAPGEEVRRKPVDVRGPEHPEHVQGNILESYEGMSHGCLLLMRLGEDAAAARAFLQGLAVTGANGAPGEVALNIGFTYSGLRSLGMTGAELAALPQEFREGMEARAGWLGDLGPNHPSRWKLPAANWPIPAADEAPRPPVRLSSVDFVIELQTRAEFREGDHLWSKQHPLYEKVKGLADQDGVQLLAVEPLRRKPLDGKPGIYEHFGFRDGISQPTHQGNGPDRVTLGELLLGYADDHGDRENPPLPVLADASFLVIRKLHQDVAAFQGFLEANQYKVPGKVLAAKMMGRDFEGHPAIDLERQPDNDFNYAGDPDGAKCPFHAHIRRANPRNGPALADRPRNSKIVPRIVRRGFSYGRRFAEDAGDPERGLFFMAYNASIADQFEVIQRWITGANSTGVASAENDPLLGVPEPGKGRTLRFHHDGEPVRCDMGDKPFVTLEWGAYLLVPSTSAVKELADRLVRKPQPDAEQAAQGTKVIEQLEMLWGVEQRRDPHGAKETLTLQWKKLLEDLSARESGTADAVWAAIRERGGALRTPYGVLVGSGELVMQVFRDHRTFSVSEYGQRMGDSLGLHYLGMDPGGGLLNRLGPSKDRYTEESGIANLWIADVSQEDAFALATEVTRKVIGALPQAMPQQTLIELRRFVSEVVAQMSKVWFGVPDGDFMQVGGAFDPDDTRQKAHCPHDFGATARYIFSPNPTSFVKKEGRNRGVALLRATERYVAQAIKDGNVPPSTLLAELHRKVGAGKTDRAGRNLIARVLAGAVHGFVGPVGGSCTSVLYQWAKREELWRYQQALLARRREEPEESAYASARHVLWDGMIRTLQVQPFPYVLHRTATRETTLGDVEVKEGDRVVLGIVSGTKDQPGDWEILLGGRYGDRDAPVHACPGWKMAFGTILGVASTLLQAGSLAPEGSTLLSLKVPEPAGA